MNTFSKIFLTGILVFGLGHASSANPLSNFFSIFQRDLTVNVLYEDHRNLIQGSEVYLAEDPKKRKLLIGSVKQISLIDGKTSKVRVVIDKQYKEKIYQTTRFVLMSGLFAEESKPYIVAISHPDPSEQALLKSGVSVQGSTFLEYQLAIAGEELKNLMESLKKQNDAILTELEQYIESFDTEALQKQMDELIDQISKFSAEQKKAFREDVLPSLRKAIESMMEKLEEQNNSEKSNELENQLVEIENIVDV